MTSFNSNKFESAYAHVAPSDSYDGDLRNVFDKNAYPKLVEEFDNDESNMNKPFDIWQGFVMTHYQKELYDFIHQFNVPNLEYSGCWHRRAGKSVFSILGVLLPHMLKKPGLYMHVFLV